MADPIVSQTLEIPPRTWTIWAAALSLLIAFTRMLALRHSTFDLLPDEAQYWSWSRALAPGYFSKPPMVAWLIAATTSVVGDDEFGVRLAAPLIHAATGIIVAVLGRAMFSARAGFMAALLYATLPGVTFSGLVISTDAPLLLFWALALLAAWQVWTGASWRWAAVLGLALGLGFLSKYAMGYFPLGLLVLVAIEGRGRFAAIWRQLAVALLIAASVLAPNLAWNAAHGWATVGHTAANADWSQTGLHLREIATFAVAQIGVLGPVLFVALLLRLWWLRRYPPTLEERFLLAFTVPVLALMIIQSGASRAHANWAAVSYVAATVLLAGWFDRIRHSWPLRLALTIQLAVFAGFTLIFAGALAISLPKSIDILHQMRGWRTLGELAWREMGKAPEGTSLAADDREVMAELDYYTRGRPFPLVMAVGNGPPGNHYELERRMTPQTGATVLLIARYADRPDILGRFEHHSLLEAWTISAGQGRQRHFYVYNVSGFKGD
jgi:4-amino-4-deoxy-L-arabinose transferase-like glycosyltransferase